jgi:adenine-specific DNA-methyltransferase
MSNTDKYRTRLINLLKELFQLDQPELDFGFYKIMHAKSVQITRFLEDDLLNVIRDAFDEVDEQRVADAKAQYEAAIEQAKKFGAPNPEDTDGVKEAKAQYEQAKDGGNAESEIYDHLYRFFERYYDNGDFMSRRYYARESDSRAAPYAVPYDGREVYLHWANKDQYYIKSSEYLSNYSFDLNEAIRQEAQKAQGAGLEQFASHDEQSLKVRFRIVDASEGEHGNIKAAADQKRFFLIHSTVPVLLENQELVIQFEYRTDPDKTGQDAKWQETRLKEAEAKIIAALQNLDAAEFLKGLNTPAPTDSKDKRTLLGKYLQKYAARNTMDYFIHKDLGGFLRRELDFYIKNEIMRLDDIENADVPQVQNYLAIIRVLRTIARQLIDFLAQLEEFQKKLWLKKKFVTESHYCITLDRIDAKFYPEIAASDRQREEWVKLFAIHEIAGDLATPGYSEPLTVEFLAANPFLLIDTALFSDNFNQRLLAEIPDLDKQCDGVLIHSENFQALGLIQDKYREQVKCIYIDPPYNTGDDDFPYKDGYMASSWFSMMHNRTNLARSLLKVDGLYFQQIGDDESARSRLMLEEIFSERKNSVIVRRGIKNVQAQFSDISRLSLGHDVIHIYGKLKGIRIPHLHHGLEAEKPGKWDTFWRGTDRPTMRYELLGQNPEKGQWRWEKNRALKAVKNYDDFIHNEAQNKSLDEWYVENLQSGVDLDFVRINEDRTVQYFVPPQSFKLVSDNWLDIPSTGTFTDFPHEKGLQLLQRIIRWITKNQDTVLDFFGGSGSTAHAAIRFPNFESRKYILVEQNNYFDTVLKPRIQKVVYSKDWKDDKPVSREGISHCFKYLRLESYEDVLNNLAFRDDAAREQALANNPDLRRDYLLNYFLDVETQGSQSLLNIADFRDPTAYQLWVKKPGSEEQNRQSIDLIETFNWLLGLWVQHSAAPQVFSAEFTRETDPDLPKDQNTRLLCTRLKTDTQGEYWFKLIEGYTLKVPGDNNSKIPTLIVWRKLTNDPEKDNAVLQTYLLDKLQISPREHTYGVVYVNGSHTLPNPVIEGEQTKVRLIEEAFHAAMWSGE